MSPDVDYRTLFRSCGEDVVIEPGVVIEHPESFVVGNRVRIMRGFTSIGKQTEVRLGDDVTIYPNTFMQGSGSLLVDHNVQFFPNTYFSIGGSKSVIEIGANTHFAVGCALYGSGGLRVGPGCGIAAHTVITTVGHDHRRTDLPLVKTGRSAPIHLVGNIWIGANVTIVGGVTIEEGCVIGAGAVVTKSTVPYGVYMGVPARLAYVRDRLPSGEAEGTGKSPA